MNKKKTKKHRNKKKVREIDFWEITFTKEDIPRINTLRTIDYSSMCDKKVLDEHVSKSQEGYRDRRHNGRW